MAETLLEATSEERGMRSVDIRSDCGIVAWEKSWVAVTNVVMSWAVQKNVLFVLHC